MPTWSDRCVRPPDAAGFAGVSASQLPPQPGRRFTTHTPPNFVPSYWTRPMHGPDFLPVSYTHLRAHETSAHL
eukprot:271313-Alexandrium_andersonii.AAC.1